MQFHLVVLPSAGSAINNIIPNVTVPSPILTRSLNQ